MHEYRGSELGIDWGRTNSISLSCRACAGSKHINDRSSVTEPLALMRNSMLRPSHPAVSTSRGSLCNHHLFCRSFRILDVSGIETDRHIGFTTIPRFAAVVSHDILNCRPTAYWTHETHGSKLTGSGVYEDPHELRPPV